MIKVSYVSYRKDSKEKWGRENRDGVLRILTFTFLCFFSSTYIYKDREAQKHTEDQYVLQWQNSISFYYQQETEHMAWQHNLTSFAGKEES